MNRLVNRFFASQTRISYRRLLAFSTSTGLLLLGRIQSDEWVYITIAFIAGEALPKMMGAHDAGVSGGVSGAAAAPPASPAAPGGELP
jgi:hypothetical protein